VDGDDVGMVKAGGGAGFALEAAGGLRAGESSDQEDFDRHEPIEAGLAGAVDDSHAAPSDLFEEFVFAEAPVEEALPGRIHECRDLG
jgi:hypothetical protein